MRKIWLVQCRRRKTFDSPPSVCTELRYPYHPFFRFLVGHFHPIDVFTAVVIFNWARARNLCRINSYWQS